MRVFFIIPGAGDSFYCGNCFRDHLQASALRRAGHEVVIMPLYLPLKQESFHTDSPLFFPATTFYTAQKFFRTKKMPKWLERVTGSAIMLRLASSLSGTASAGGMEEMTLSMITGDGRAFREQAGQLVDWMKGREKPDVVHLSSTLLIGIAKVIRQELNIPVVCSVQDEEVWIDSLGAKHASIAWQEIADSDALADALEKILTDEKLMAQCRENALSLSSSRYNDRISAERLSAIYHQASFRPSAAFGDP